MAFTMTYSAEGHARPEIICDRCDQPAGGDGLVIWGQQYVDDDGVTRPFTTVATFELDEPTIPFSVFVACNVNCLEAIVRIYGNEVGLTGACLSVRDYLAWLCLSTKVDPVQVAIEGWDREAAQRVAASAEAATT